MKRIMALLLAFSMMFSLAACGGKGGDSEKAESKTDSSNVSEKENSSKNEKASENDAGNGDTSPIADSGKWSNRSEQLITKADLSGKKTGDIVQFGYYPQTQVTDKSLISNLDRVEKKWVSYDYYAKPDDSSDPVPSDYMKYADFTYNGDKYRAVTFTKYRAYTANAEQSETYSYQDDMGYTVNNTYYFKFEPLNWFIADDNGLLVSRNVIDNQAFLNIVVKETVKKSEYDIEYHYYNSEDKTTFAYDYANSSIHAWLSDNFYNTAFSDAEKKNIAVSKLNNNKPVYGEGKTSAKDTEDKVFLLSDDEFTAMIKNEAIKNFGGPDTTDYSCCQGSNKQSETISIFSLRSPYDINDEAYHLSEIYFTKSSHAHGDVDRLSGVLPALRLS